MEEVRSYWQVASISHFCNLFRKPFKLPNFEPEELEQAFILDVPIPPKSHLLNINLNNQDDNSATQLTNDKVALTNTNGLTNQPSPNDAQPDTGQPQEHDRDQDQELQQNHQDEVVDTTTTSNHNDKTNNNNNNLLLDEETQQSSSLASPAPPSSTKSEYTPSVRFQQQLISDNNTNSDNNQNNQDNKADEQPQHLLVKLAIALLKPHFNTKLTLANWENYLKRIIDSNWVELEHYPSPFQVPIITQDGVELTKNLVFNELTLSDKIDVIYALCDYRLWCEDAVEATKDYPMEELRLESVGKDSHGYEYWYFSGTRLFRENKELSQDLILRKKRIKELEFNLIDLDKARILREQEEKRKIEMERARQLAAEAREAKSAAKKKHQEQEAQNKRRKSAIPSLPPRTGLRERRSSTTGNNSNNSSQPKQNKQKQQQVEEEPRETRTTRSRVAKSQQEDQQTKESSASSTPTPQTTATKASSRARNSKQNDKSSKLAKSSTPDISKKSPEEECKAELERLTISAEDRAEAWHMQCDSLEDWESFAVKFEKSKSTNEKYLTSYINEYILPTIRAIYAKRAAEIKRKEKELLLSLTYSSRRVSTRIISRQKQEEEEERLAQLREAETRKKKAEAEIRLRAELEKEIRTRQNRFVINGGDSSACSEDGTQMDHESSNGARYNLRQTVAISNENEFDGIIHPDNLSEFYEAIELVIDTVRTSKHAWPFVNPVPETEPGYYDLIKEPMDLWKIRTKIEFREYKSFIELEKDFQLLVNNCEKFNGPKNVYTKMVYKLWKSFRKNVRLYLERDLSMNEYETFLYPPAPKKEPTPPPTPIYTEPSQLKTEQVDMVVDNQDPLPPVEQANVQLTPQQQPLPPPPPPIVTKPIIQLPNKEPISIPNLKQELVPNVIQGEVSLTAITKIEPTPLLSKRDEFAANQIVEDNPYPVYLVDDDLKGEIAPEPIMELEI